MKKRLLIVSALTLSLYAGQTSAATDPTPVQENVQIQDKQQIYGSELMTEQERVEFRARMQAAKTVEEREQIRSEHHKAMQERAASRGMTLPEQRPGSGGGMGPGGGMGQGGGMGSGGGGMGSGGGRGN